MRRLLTIAALAGLLGAARAERLNLVWPTPNTAFFDGKGEASYVQPTASGVVESGHFGCARSGGAQFHEGVDLKPVGRDRRGEPTDPIFAAMKGVVRHISRSAGDSNYGRYIVLEHPDAHPALYTLYAHLSAITPGLREGETVEKGQTIAVMGRSSSSMAIPRDRAHLHFEIGLWLTRDFQRWYYSKKFGSANDHGMFNGMNLVGIDPLDFFEKWRSRRIDDGVDYFRQMNEAVRVRVTTRRIPDFAERYPALLKRELPADRAVGGWEIAFNEMGVPFSLTPLTPLETMGSLSGDVKVQAVNEALLRRFRCKHLAVYKRGRWVPARDLAEKLELLFGPEISTR